MLKKIVLLALVLLAGAAHAAGDKTTVKSAEGAATLSLSDYDVLFKRNLFSREQPRPKNEFVEKHKIEVVEKKEEKPAGPKLEADIVLIGIVMKDDQPVAFLEDRRAGKALSAKKDDVLASGKVGSITMESLEFISGGKSVSVVIGNNLEGSVPVVKSAETVSTVPATGGATATTTTGTTGGAGAADDANLSIIEKLRRKRLKELGK